MANVKFLTGSNTDFSNLQSKDPNTLYFVQTTDGKSYDLYKGEKKVGSSSDVAALAARLATAEGNITQEVKDREAADTAIKTLIGTVASDKTVVGLISDEATAREAADKAITDTIGTVAKGQTVVGLIAEAKAAADAAQDDVDALETFVGTLPKGETSATVVAYIDKKTTGIASASDVQELAGRVTTAEGEIDTLQSEMDAVEAKAAANEKAIGVLNGVGEGSVKKQIDDAFNDFATKVSDDGVVNTYKELIDYCATHSSEAAEMAGNIQANATAIAELEAFVGELPEGTQAATVIAYVNDKVAAEQTRATGVESGLDTRLAAVEAKFTGDNSVAKQIEKAVAAEKAERVAADQAHDTAIAEAKAAADAAQGDVDALEILVGTLEGTGATSVVDYIKKLVEAEIKNRKDADDALDTRVQAVEAAVEWGTIA